MLKDVSKDWEIILASKSPRRNELLKNLGICFKVILREVDERFPSQLSNAEVANYISQKKASVFNINTEKQMVITGDTIVCKNQKVLGKPKDKEEAFEMIKSLSGEVHQVISSYTIKTKDQEITKSDQVNVFFEPLSEEEIKYYISNYSCLDKAGAYGIQDWIGQIGVQKIEGSFYTVMGMPIHLLYADLKAILLE